MGHSNVISWVQAAILTAGPLFQQGQDNHFQIPQRRNDVGTTDNRTHRKGSYSQVFSQVSGPAIAQKLHLLKLQMTCFLRQTKAASRC